ncbi:hypothetical protein Bbelb_042100 [Branchiostoma belcheri]|nr:hypothetical protein Bbelb_042100 [Branchiostoma belcheri]
MTLFPRSCRSHGGLGLAGSLAVSLVRLTSASIIAVGPSHVRAIIQETSRARQSLPDGFYRGLDPRGTERLSGRQKRISLLLAESSSTPVQKYGFGMRSCGISERGIEVAEPRDFTSFAGSSACEYHVPTGIQATLCSRKI